jgi:RHS repeat-associated protein
MVAINKILLPECAGGWCGGDTDICTDSRVHRRNAENRAPATRNHRQAQPLVDNLYQGMTLDAVTGLYYERARDYSPSLGRWLTRDPIGYRGGINLYGYVNSSPVGSVDAQGRQVYLGPGSGWGDNSPPPFGLSADRWESPGAHFVGGMGKFTAQVDWKSAYSSSVVVTFFPGNRLKNKKCGCKLIGFVQYEKDATAFSSHGSVALPSGWSVDSGFPYPYQTEWSPGGKHYAELRDAPGLRNLGPYLYNQWVFEARDVAVCLSGHDKGDSFGAVYWGFYFNWGAGRVTRWVGGQGVKTGPVASQNVSVDILRPFAPLP